MPHIKYENDAGVVRAMQASIKQPKFGAEAVGEARFYTIAGSHKKKILESYTLRTSSICRLVMNKYRHETWAATMDVLYNPETKAVIWPSCTHLSIYTKDRDVCIAMIIAALFNSHETEAAKTTTNRQRVKKTCYIFTMEA